MNLLLATPTLGPQDAGLAMRPDEFVAAEFEPGWRYELIRGVLVVSPAPLPEERDPNDELGYWLRDYKDHHPQGRCLDKTLPEHDIRVGDERRRADRVIWVGLGRRPRRGETPAVAIEFVSEGKRNETRDYEEKRREYEAAGVQEYWIIDRFRRTMTVYKPGGVEQVIGEADSYTTPLLPGFELSLARLLAVADSWSE